MRRCRLSPRAGIQTEAVPIASDRLGRHGDAMAEQGRAAANGSERYTVLVRGLVLLCSIGILPQEYHQRQRVRVSVELTAAPGLPFPGENRRRVINYEKVVAAIRAIAAGGHIELCEGFAERVAEACFADPRVASVRVCVEKLDVFPEAESVGAILERSRPV